jgi:hypothetical protein
VTNNCLLQEKDYTLYLLDRENVCKKIERNGENIPKRHLKRNGESNIYIKLKINLFLSEYS